MSKRTESTPAQQAIRAGKGGIVPPIETRWTPGESGNPKGRPSAGASIKEWVNQLHELTEAEVRVIARDQSAPVYKRAAAERWLRAIEVCDIATFQAVLDGTKTLSKLSEEGVNTEVVKKLKFGKDGPEIELHDRGGEDFDRICDRTDGKPKESVAVTTDGMPQSITMQVLGPAGMRRHLDGGN